MADEWARDLFTLYKHLNSKLPRKSAYKGATSMHCIPLRNQCGWERGEKAALLL